MKILICDNLNQQVYKELETIGDCLDISKSASKEEDLVYHIKDCEIVVIRSATKLTKEVLDKAEYLSQQEFPTGTSTKQMYEILDNS